MMATGDHPHTAVAVAREIGLVLSAAPTLLTGDDLGRMSDTQLQLALDAPEIVCARVTADQKLRIVTAFQRKRCIVAVTGDGVNDAPALRAADIGIAMGISGTDVAREASDLVLLDDNFASIVNAVEEGRTVFENIRKFLTYILTSNVPELVPYLAFAFARVPLALTVIQILAVDLGTDMVPALGLGAEPPDSRVMQRPPRSRQDRLLTPGLLVRAYLFLGSFEAVAAMAAFFFVLAAAGWQWGQELSATDMRYRQATTACLTAIVLMQVVNVHLCRSRRTSIVSRPLFGNALITAGIVAEIGVDSRDRLQPPSAMPCSALRLSDMRHGWWFCLLRWPCWRSMRCKKPLSGGEKAKLPRCPAQGPSEAQLPGPDGGPAGARCSEIPGARQRLMGLPPSASSPIRRARLPLRGYSGDTRHGVLSGVNVRTTVTPGFQPIRGALSSRGRTLPSRVSCSNDSTRRARPVHSPGG